MAEAITVARPYAEAIFKLGVSGDSLAQWSKILQLCADIVENDQIKLLIGNPIVSADKLGSIFLEIGRGKFNEEAKNLIKILAENKRILVLPQISQLYEQLKAQHEGTLDAKIVSAFALEGKQLRKLVENLELKFKRKIEPQVSIDPELIGGIKVELEAMAIALKS